jgi:hypothetical protein
MSEFLGEDAYMGQVALLKDYVNLMSGFENRRRPDLRSREAVGHFLRRVR